MSTPIFYQGNINIYIGMNPWDTMSIKSNKKTAICMAVYFWWTRRDCIFPCSFSLHGPLSLRMARTAHSLVLANWRSEPFHGFSSAWSNTKKRPYKWPFISGGRAGTRTLDPLIKSQLLYQLSYASRTILSDTNPISAVHRTDG